MADKSGGIDFDRQVFVQPDAPKPRPASPIVGMLFFLVALAAIGFLAYKLLPQFLVASTKPGAPTLAEVNKRLSQIEKRLDRLEAHRRAEISDRTAGRRGQPEARSSSANEATHAISSARPTLNQASPARVRRGASAATQQRLAAVQNNVTALENDAAANSEAWQATTNKMADVAGQMGTQSVEVLRNRDELNALLAETEMEAIPFELYRGANPQPVGPVSLALKSSSPKHQRYTLCVYIQNSCTELKNRMLHEVVQFVVSRNSVPLKVVGTKLSDNEMVGFLEVPRHKSGTLSPRR